MVHLDNTTSDATISLTAYDFDENSQWVGVGISTDTFMVSFVTISEKVFLAGELQSTLNVSNTDI